jgi:hypothetical protein
MTRFSVRATALLAILLAALMGMASPALADLDAGAGSIKDSVGLPDSGSDNDGDADSDSGTGYTEDNDTNDGGTANNQPDDDDNAHPSGNDRSTENGGSGTQGKAESNPDDSKGPQRYEGAKGDDKPNGPGGKDVADQDGNNGCGNDDDFDDDNNGWCGKPHDKGSQDNGAGGNDCSEAGNGWECTAVSGGAPRGARGSWMPAPWGHGATRNPNNGHAWKTWANDASASHAKWGTLVSSQSSSSNDHRGNRTITGGAQVDGGGLDDAETSVLGKVLDRAGPVGAVARGTARALGAALPFTGNADLLAFLLIAAGLIVGGIFLMRRKSA